MARIRSLTGEHSVLLDAGWQMALSADGARPAEAADWIDAPVPGTAAQALENAGKATPELLADLQRRHIWYRCRFRIDPTDRCRLRFAGLAPHCDIHIGDEIVATAPSMFDPVDVPVPENITKTTLYIHFKPLTAQTLPAATRRQRWRPHLVASPHMRMARASLIGHMPGWCPETPPVGPYRRVEIIREGPVTAHDARVRTWLDGATGHVEISFDIKGLSGPLTASCWDAAAEMVQGADGRYRAHLTIAKPPLWWPHSHGEPNLLPLTLYGEDIEIALGFVGFRTLELDRGADGDGFGLVVNGVPVFCRGANWVPRLHLPGEYEDYEPVLRQMREAGMNMLRISGIMTREAPELFEICDKLGIFVSYDEAFANFDYDFEALSTSFRIDRSVSQFLHGVETSPSLAMITGGSEMAQQAAMLSLPESVWNLDAHAERLTGLVHAVRPDVIVLANSPYGGELPFQPDKGVSHYFGVGAYQRPLEDARRAHVRFATECLAFANLPQPERLPAIAGDARPGTPEWKRLVVRDLKADWDFEDTRDFYLGLLYGVEPGALRSSDPERYLALSCAVPGEVMEATFAEWRRAGSVTRGGLVWFNRDIAPGFGWGVVDAGGVAKPAWHALRRAFRTLTVALTDEGLNGLHCHLINETRDNRDVTLTLTCLGEDGSVVIDGARALTLAPRSVVKLSSAAVFGMFFDVTYAYRFGPPAHVATVARLVDTASSELLAEGFHFPLGRGHAVADVGLCAELETDGSGRAVLALTTTRLAQSVHIACEGFLPDDDWFHLAPGAGRRIRLKGQGKPRGTVTALNHAGTLRFG